MGLLVSSVAFLAASTSSGIAAIIRILRILFLLHYPDIAELHRHAMLLQLDWSRGSFAKARGIQRDRPEFAIVIDFRSVEEHGHPRTGCLIPRFIETRRCEVDI